MNIEIASYYCQEEQREKYTWDLYDGPDGIDHYYGVEDSLSKCMEEIIKKRIINSLTYTDNDEELKAIMRDYLSSPKCNPDGN